MSLEGAKFICLDEAGNHGEIVLAKGRKFTVGYYVSCDFVLVDERAKGVHCEIESDAFGRVTIRNLSSDKPILVNGSAVEIKRILLNNSKLSILDKEYLWLFPKSSSNEFEDLPREAASTPQKHIGIPEQPPNSCPDFKLHRELPKRFTVHNFAYCIQSDEEGNTSSDSNDENTNEEEVKQTNKCQNELETQTTEIIESNDIIESNRSVTPEPKDETQKSTTALLETPKMNLINCTKDKENKSTQKKNKQLLTMCHQSDVVITSFSPRETGVKIEKSFATIVKPKVLVTKTPATPKSVYSTPKCDLNENDQAEEDDKELITFHTPSTSKKGGTSFSISTASSKVLKNSSMHLIDLTTPNKLRPASPYLKSALKASAKKNPTQIAGDKSAGGSKLSSEEQLGLSALPSTPALSEASNSPLETPSSVISVSSSTDTSSIIEVTSDGSNMGITPGSATGLTTPIKSQTRTGACTPKRTPQSLMKRALLTSAKKQNTTPQRNANTATTTPRRESINRIPLRSNLALLRTPVTPQVSTGDESNSQLPRRHSMSTPTRKSISSRSRFDSPTTSTSLTPASSSTSSRLISRRSSLNPIAAARALPTSTPVSGASNNSALKTRAACKTSPLHKVRKSVGGVPLSSHISKARRSIVLPASTSKITSIKEKSPQQVMSDRLVSRARKSLCVTPISARSRNLVTAAKTPPQPPSSILKNRKVQSAKKPERKAVLFADKKTTDSCEVNDLSRTFIIDSDEEENTDKDKGKEKPKDATFSPEKESKETNETEKSTEKEPTTIEIPLDVEEVTDLTKYNSRSEGEDNIKTSNKEAFATVKEENEEKPMVTEESFAEIINHSQESQEENKLTKTIEIPDSPKESSQTESQDSFSEVVKQTESQESFAEVVKQIAEENKNENAVKSKEITEITQNENEKNLDFETGFGEESVVEIIETSNSENVLNEDIEKEISNKAEDDNEIELREANEMPQAETVETEICNTNIKSSDVQDVDEKKSQKSEYKPIVEDITLEGSLIEKETNVSKQPLYEDITLEVSSIEDKVKSEEIVKENVEEKTKEVEVSKILETTENSEKQIEKDSDEITKESEMCKISETVESLDKGNVEVSNITQEPESLIVKEIETSEKSNSNTNEVKLKETEQVIEEILEENIKEQVVNSEIIEELQSSRSEQPTTIIEHNIDDDLENTNKLLEEIEDVLNKSDEIKQKHLSELEEATQESDKPLTEEFESEKLTQETTEETISIISEDNKLQEVPEELNDPAQKSVRDSNDKNIQEDLEEYKKEAPSQKENISEEKEYPIEENKESAECTKRDNLISENIISQSEDNKSIVQDISEIKECEIVEQNSENVKETEIVQNEGIVENIISHTEDNISKEENTESVAQERSEISESEQNKIKAAEQELKETEKIVQNENNSDKIVSSTVDHIAIEEKSDLNTEEKSKAIVSDIVIENDEDLETSNRSQEKHIKSSQNIVSETENTKKIDDNNKLITEKMSATKEIDIVVHNENKFDEQQIVTIQNQETKTTEIIFSDNEDNFNKKNVELKATEIIQTETDQETKSENVENEDLSQSQGPKQETEIIQKETDQETKSENVENEDLSQCQAPIKATDTADSDKKQDQNISNEVQTIKSEDNEKSTQLIAIKKKIENASSLTPRRSTRRASQSAETPLATTELSFTPRRSARRASMSAESTSTLTPTKRTTRRASLSVVNETPLTPKPITKRRPSMSLDDETPKPSTSKTPRAKTPRKQLEQRMVIPEEIDKVVGAVIIEEEEPSAEVVQVEEKKRRTFTSDAASTNTSIPPLKTSEQSVHIPEEMAEVVDNVITETEVLVEKTEKCEDSKEIIPGDKFIKDSSTEETKEIPAEHTKDLKKDTTSEVDNLPSDENRVTTTAETFVSEQTPVVEENVLTTEDDFASAEKQDNIAENIEKDSMAHAKDKNNDIKVATEDISASTADNLDLLVREESMIAQDVSIDTHVKPADQIVVQLKRSSTKEDEVDKLLSKDDIASATGISKVHDNIEKLKDCKKDEEDIFDSKENNPNKSADEKDSLVLDQVKTPIKTIVVNTEQKEISTPTSITIIADSPKTPLMADMRELSKTPKTDVETPQLGDVCDSVRSPKEIIDNEEESVSIAEKLAIVADSLKTPTSKETIEISTPKANKQVTIVANSPQTPLMTGMRELLKTPKCEMNTPKMVGLRDLVKTPKAKTETEQEEIVKLAVVAELVKTPQSLKNPEKEDVEMPSSSLKNDNLKGVKELLKTPKSCSTPRFKGMRELMQTPKLSSTPLLGGAKELLDSSDVKETSEVIVEHVSQKNSDEIPSTSSKNVDSLKGVKELMKTPKSCSTPRLKGIRELMQTPKMSSTPLMGGIRELMDSSAQENDGELEKYLRTPTAKNIMIPTMPSSAIIEKSSDSIEISTEYDLNATHEGETANLEDIFKTPVASRFVERITASYYGEEGDERDESVEKFHSTKTETLQDTLNKSAEEAFDKLIGQETQIQTPIRKVYPRKSYGLQTPQAQSPFTAADVLSDLPKTDVEEWIETLDQAEPPTILECDDNDENEQVDGDKDEVVEQDFANISLKVEDDETSVSEQSLSENDKQNISANESVIPETCTKVYLQENTLTNITTASSTNTSTKDPLLNTNIKMKEKETRPVTPIDAEISGINLLDQTVESVQDEPSMLDEPLLVEEPSMFEEPLMVSDNESEVADNTLNNVEDQEVAVDDTNDLSEPLMVSDSEDLNQSQEIETNYENVDKQNDDEVSKLDINVEEKSILEKESNASLAEDPLETKNKETESSVIIVEEDNKSSIEINARETTKNENVQYIQKDNSTKSSVEQKSIRETESSPAEESVAIDNKHLKETEISENITMDNSEEPGISSTVEKSIIETEESLKDIKQKSSEEPKISLTTQTEESNKVRLLEANENLEPEVDAAETLVIKEQELIEEIGSVSKNDKLDAKEVSIKETKIMSNESEDIFLDTSVTEIFEETSIANEERVESMEVPEPIKEKTESYSKAPIKESSSQFNHECKDIFMDSSNIDESFADEATNEENDVENESAMVEVTTKEITRNKTKDSSLTVVAENESDIGISTEEDIAQESNDAIVKDVDISSENITIPNEEQSDIVNVIEDRTDNQQNIQETESLKETHTKSDETKENQSEKTELDSEQSLEVSKEEASDETKSCDTAVIPLETATTSDEAVGQKIDANISENPEENIIQDATRSENPEEQIIQDATISTLEGKDDVVKLKPSFETMENDTEYSIKDSATTDEQLAESAHIVIPIKEEEVIAQHIEESSSGLNESESYNLDDKTPSENNQIENELSSESIPTESSLFKEIPSCSLQAETEKCIKLSEKTISEDEVITITENISDLKKSSSTSMYTGVEEIKETETTTSIEKKVDMISQVVSSAVDESKLTDKHSADESDSIVEEEETKNIESETSFEEKVEIEKISDDNDISTAEESKSTEKVTTNESEETASIVLDVEENKNLESETSTSVKENMEIDKLGEEVSSTADESKSTEKLTSNESEESASVVLDVEENKNLESETSTSVKENVEIGKIDEVVSSTAEESKSTEKVTTNESEESASVVLDVEENKNLESETSTSVKENVEIGKIDEVVSSTAEESKSTEKVTTNKSEESASIVLDVEETKSPESETSISVEEKVEIDTISDEKDISELGEEVSTITEELKQTEKVPRNVKENVEIDKLGEEVSSTAEESKSTEKVTANESEESASIVLDVEETKTLESETSTSVEEKVEIDTISDEKDISVLGEEVSKITEELKQTEKVPKNVSDTIILEEKETKNVENETTISAGKKVEIEKTIDKKDISKHVKDVSVIAEESGQKEDVTRKPAEPLQIVKSYDFEIKINDTEHQHQKEPVIDNEKPTTSLRKRKCSQSIEVSNTDLDIPTTDRRENRHTKAEEQTREITPQTQVESLEQKEIEKVEEISTTKTIRRKRTASESSQDSTQGEEHSSSSRRDRRKVIKKPVKEKLEELKEETSDQQEEPKDEKPKRKRTTSESSQGSVKDDNNSTTTRRTRRKIQKTPAEETVVEQNERTDEQTTEEQVPQTEEHKEENENKILSTEEIPVEIHNLQTLKEDVAESIIEEYNVLSEDVIMKPTEGKENEIEVEESVSTGDEDRAILCEKPKTSATDISKENIVQSPQEEVIATSVNKGSNKNEISEVSKPANEEHNDGVNRSRRQATVSASNQDSVYAEKQSQEISTVEFKTSETSDVPKEEEAIDVKSKLSDIIEINEPENTETVKNEVQEVEINTADESKEHPVKRGRRKPTVSESSQCSVHDNNYTSQARKTRRNVQKIAEKEVVVEEYIATEDITTTTSLINKEEIVTTENKLEIESKTIAVEQTIPSDEIKVQTNRQNRRKPTVSESSQGSIHEDDTLHTRRVRRKVQKAPAEEIVLEENEEKLSSKLAENPQTDETKEDVPAKPEMKELIAEIKDKDKDICSEKAEVFNTKDNATGSTNEIPALKVNESVQNINQNENSTPKLIKEDQQKVAEKIVEAHVEDEEYKETEVKPVPIKRDLVETVSEEPTTSRKGRRKVQTEVLPIESITSIEIKKVPESKTSTHEDVKASTESIATTVGEILVTCNKEDHQEVEDSVKHTSKRGGRRKIDVEEVPKESVVNMEDTSHATRRGGRHKAAASEISTSDISKVRSTSRNRKTPVDKPTSTTEPVMDEKILEKINEIPPTEQTITTEITKVRSTSRNRKTPIDLPTSAKQQEEQMESIKEIPTAVEVLKDYPSSNHQEEDTEKTPKTIESTEIANIVILDDSSDEDNHTNEDDVQLDAAKKLNKKEDNSVKKRVKRIRTVSETSQGSLADEKPTKRRAIHQMSEIDEDHEDISTPQNEHLPEQVDEVQTEKEVTKKLQKSSRRHAAAIQEDHVEHHEEISTKSRRRRGRHDDNEEHYPTTEQVEEIQKPAEEEPLLSEVKITEVNLEPEEAVDKITSPQVENHTETTMRKGRRKAAGEEYHSEEQETLGTTKKRAAAKEIEHDHGDSSTSSKRRVGRKKQVAEEHETEEEPAAQIETNTKRRIIGKKKQAHGKDEHHHNADKGSEETKHDENTDTDENNQGHAEPTSEKHDTEEAKHVESGESTSKRRNIGRKKHEEVEDQHVPEKHDTEDETLHIESTDASNKRRVTGRKKQDNEPDLDQQNVANIISVDIENKKEQPPEETKKGRGRRKRNEHQEQPEQPTTSHSPDIKHRGRKRKESHADSHDQIPLEKDQHSDEKSVKELETKLDILSAHTETPQRVAPAARRGRKASTIEHITAESQEVDDTPGRRARNVPQRRAATAYHNYDETSDGEVTTKTKKKTDSPRKPLEATKTSPTATITSAPIINSSPSPSSTASATTARGRTRKPTAKVQQFLEEERAKGETPKKRGLLAAAAGMDNTATPQRTPARRGRKASTIDTEVEGTPQATKGRGRGKHTANAKEDHSVEPEKTSVVVEEKEVDIHTTPPPAHPAAKGRKGGRKAKITEEEHHKNDEPPAKKSPLELEIEKQDSSPSVDAPTPPTRIAGRRNAAAAAKARIEEDALAAAAIDPPKRARARKAPTKVSTPVVVVATTDTEVHSSEVEDEKVAKNKNSPQKREHRLASATTIEGGAEDIEEHIDTEAIDKPANKRGRKAATATTATDSPAVPVKRSRKGKTAEEVGDTETSGESKATRGRGRGRKNVHFDEHEETEAATTSTHQNTPDIESPAVETSEPVKRGTRTRRK